MTDELVLEEPEGRITVAASALEQVVQRAAEAVDGARVRRPRRGLDVRIAGRKARVGLDLAVRFGTVLPDVALQVQEQVASALAKMCALEVEAVDVSIDELDD